MEIDITHFFETAAPYDFSGSIAERGPNAAKETWSNALEQARAEPLLKESDCDYFRRYMREYGAWSEEEMAAWSIDDCNALLIQLISGDMREGNLDCAEPDWEQYEKDAEDGRISGNIFKAEDGKMYYSLCH